MGDTCASTHLCPHTDKCTHAGDLTRTLTCHTYTCAHLCINEHAHSSTQIHIHVHLHISVHRNVHVHTCTHVEACVSMCTVWTLIHVRIHLCSTCSYYRHTYVQYMSHRWPHVTSHLSHTRVFCLSQGTSPSIFCTSLALSVLRHI